VRSCRVTTSRPSTRIWTRFAKQNDALDERLRDRLENPIENPGDADRDALREEVAAMQRAVGRRPPAHDRRRDAETDLSDGTLAYETVFDATIPAEAVAVTATYGDGTTERVPDEYVTVDQGESARSRRQPSRSRSIPSPTVPRSRTYACKSPAPTDSERVASALRVRRSIAIWRVSTRSRFRRSIRPDDRVTLGVDAGEQTRIVDVAARNPAGESVTATVDDGQATVHTDGQGLHAIALTYEQSGIEVTETLRIEAGATSGSTPATVRLAEGRVGRTRSRPGSPARPSTPAATSWRSRRAPNLATRRAPSTFTRSRS